ncbi:MAG: peptidoglycan DD-metalloendopeptidase family protein [Paenibacillaceae bacterium]
MRKLLFAVLVAVLLFSLVIHPQQGYTSTISDIDNALAKNNKKVNEAQRKREAANQLAKTLLTKKNIEIMNKKEIEADIAEQVKKLNGLNKQKNEITLALYDTADQLDEANKRVKSRDGLLKSRLRLMYMNGSVSYMDVLFSVTSFSDFLDRFLALQSIVRQDKEILEQNKTDHAMIAEKKKDKESKLTQLNNLTEQEEAVKDKLYNQEQLKEVVIASIDQKAKEADEVSEEEEQALIALAAQRAELNKKRKKEIANSFKYSGGKVMWPVPGRTTLSDYFGYRIDPIKKVRKLHKGIDIPAPKGTTIVAAESGIVLIASQVSGYGNTVVIDHGGGLWTWYGHIRNGGIFVEEGQKVKKGDKIAEVGSTGDSTGNHLHFEVRINQEAVNPLPYLQ